MSSFEIISDYSKANLKEIPENILDMTNLKMLFLERNLLVKLPDNFFYRLPNLMWLDLRNNQLDKLPTSIAHHQHLEHLLVTNNHITKLPNELGLVEPLKALQVTGNPLIYPPKKIIQEGTKSIKRFLREQYEIECAQNAEKEKQAFEAQEEYRRELLAKAQSMEMREEKLIRVHEKESDLKPTKSHEKISREKFNSVPKLTGNGSSRESSMNRQQTKTIEHIQNILSDPNGLNPTLRVKKIGYPIKPPDEPLKIIHNVSKGGSKISLKSYYQKSGVKPNLHQIPENVLKEGWLNKLRILLNDQERILQQERNLKALSTWRQKSPSTPKVFSEPETTARTFEPPYATYPEYARIPSRQELASHLRVFLREPNVVNKNISAHRLQPNLDKVINDLVEQLKEMETHYNAGKSPRSEINQAGQQIQTIIDIHKKLLQLKSANDYS